MSNTQSTSGSQQGDSGRSAPGDIPLVFGRSKPTPYYPQRNANWVYWIAVMYLRIYYLFSARVRVEGWENVPRKGGGVVVCNHGPGNDYFPLGISLPRMPHFMAKIEIFQWHPIMNYIMTTGGAIPVDRGVGDVEALRASVDVVKSGELLAMFPEGHRSDDGKLQTAKTGATRIALEANVPVIPVAVINAAAGWDNFPRFWNRPEVLVRIGRPFVLEGKGAQDRAAVVAGTRRIMLAIAELLPYDMRGVWADMPQQTARPERAHAHIQEERAGT
jgi:1-acyl-sn-glycerol-3-phosphate acyltransferase